MNFVGANVTPMRAMHDVFARQMKTTATCESTVFRFVHRTSRLGAFLAWGCAVMRASGRSPLRRFGTYNTQGRV